MLEQVTTCEEMKAFSCSVWNVKDEVNVNSSFSFDIV